MDEKWAGGEHPGTGKKLKKEVMDENLVCVP